MNFNLHDAAFHLRKGVKMLRVPLLFVSNARRVTIILLFYKQYWIFVPYCMFCHAIDRGIFRRMVMKIPHLSFSSNLKS